MIYFLYIYFQKYISSLPLGIVYCFSRKNSEQVAMELKTHDISAFCYHADMEPADKSKVHSAWTKGKLKVFDCKFLF